MADRSWWYDVIYYEDDGNDEPGEIAAYGDGYARKRDAISEARQEHPTLHAHVFFRSETRGDSGNCEWSRSPLVPKDTSAALRWLLKAVKIGPETTKRVAKIVAPFAQAEER